MNLLDDLDSVRHTSTRTLPRKMKDGPGDFFHTGLASTGFVPWTSPLRRQKIRPEFDWDKETFGIFKDRTARFSSARSSKAGAYRLFDETCTRPSANDNP